MLRRELTPLPLTSNAPREWPQVNIEFKTRYRREDLLVAIENTLGKGGMRLHDAGKRIPDEKGVFTVDLFIEGHPVFLITEVSQTEADLYWARKRILRRKGFPEALYYAPQPLPRPASMPLLREIYDQGFVLEPQLFKKPGTYWMLRFPKRKAGVEAALRIIDEHYSLLEGREWVGLGIVLEALGAAPEWRAAAELHDRLVTIPLGASGAPNVILSFRKDRGLRIHFEADTPFGEQLGWWTWFHGFIRRRWPENAPGQHVSPASIWWHEVSRQVFELSDLEGIGRITL